MDSGTVRAKWVRRFGRLGRAWIAIELSAGIAALCLLVAVLPAIDCLMALPSGWGWEAALGASANSGAGALWLGRRALVVPAELLQSG